MDNVLSTSQQEGVWKCMDTPGVLWLCLDWVMHVEFQLWNLQANSWLMCSVSISPSLAHGRGITRGFWCFWKVFQWCLRTLLWRTTFRRNVFFALMVRMWFLEKIWNLFRLAWCLCSTTTTSKLHFVFQTVLARLFFGLAFVWKTGCCTCNICKWKMGMDEFVFFFSWNLSYKTPETKCMKHALTGSSMCTSIKETKETARTEASSLDMWRLSFPVACVKRSESEVEHLESLRFWACVFLHAIYRHRRSCSDRKRRNGAHAASGCNPEFSHHPKTMRKPNHTTLMTFLFWLRKR